jgi:lambda family phage minor tail protein L
MNTFFKLNNYVVLDLYELQLESNEGYLRFHGSKNFSNNLIFQGQQYVFIPCELSNIETSSNGKQSKPTIKIANINNYISHVLKDRSDLIGKSFNRKKILAKDLDIENFDNGINPFGTSNFKTYIAYDKFIVNLKKLENKEHVEIELSTKVDLQNLNIPARKVTNDTCSWGYRCYGCNYGNTPDYSGPIVNISYLESNSQPSSVFFAKSQWGNVYDAGIPIADENDKTFLASYKADLANNTYGLVNMQYREKWSATGIYMQGDFVYLDFVPNVSTVESNNYNISLSNKPKNFYVCLENNVVNKQPNLNTNVWKQDQCSKTLRGCLLRFKDYLSKDGNVTSNKTLPYGGFPATFQYDNKK